MSSAFKSLIEYPKGTIHKEWCVWCNKLTAREEEIGLCTDIISCAECGKMQEFYDKTEDYE